MNTHPLVSVIIPTHNRRDALLRCLESLARQTISPNRFEVVVVADRCHDDTEVMVRNYATRAPFRLHVVSHAAGSAAATRNQGATIATGTILLFLDDDMRATPQLIAAHLDVLQDADVSIGYSRPTLPAHPSRWQRDARRWWEDRFRAMATPGHRFSYEDVFSGNLALRATHFAQLGGFDLAFAGRLEDYELGMRLITTGATVRFSYAAAATHFDQSDLATWLRRVGLDAAAHVQLAQRYPELRGPLFGHIHTQVSHEMQILRRLAMAMPSQGEKLIQGALSAIWLCEHLALSRSRERLIRLAREYIYWRGVATELGPTQCQSWLAAAQPPTLADDAPTIDLAHLPPAPELARRLAIATERGVYLYYANMEAWRVPPQPGAEALTVAHLQRILQAQAHNAVIPAVALQIFTSGDGLCWPASSPSI